MTVEYTNNNFDHFSIEVDKVDISFDTLTWTLKGRYHNNSGVVHKYVNILTEDVKRK